MNEIQPVPFPPNEIPPVVASLAAPFYWIEKTCGIPRRDIQQAVAEGYFTVIPKRKWNEPTDRSRADEGVQHAVAHLLQEEIGSFQPVSLQTAKDYLTLKNIQHETGQGIEEIAADFQKKRRAATTENADREKRQAWRYSRPEAIKKLFSLFETPYVSYGVGRPSATEPEVAELPATPQDASKTEIQELLKEHFYGPVIYKLILRLRFGLAGENETPQQMLDEIRTDPSLSPEVKTRALTMTPESVTREEQQLLTELSTRPVHRALSPLNQYLLEKGQGLPGQTFSAAEIGVLLNKTEERIRAIQQSAVRRIYAPDKKLPGKQSIELPDFSSIPSSYLGLSSKDVLQFLSKDIATERPIWWDSRETFTPLEGKTRQLFQRLIRRLSWDNHDTDVIFGTYKEPRNWRELGKLGYYLLLKGRTEYDTRGFWTKQETKKYTLAQKMLEMADREERMKPSVKPETELFKHVEDVFGPKYKEWLSLA